jgi:hypothetical protein
MSRFHQVQTIWSGRSASQARTGVLARPVSRRQVGENTLRGQSFLQAEPEEAIARRHVPILRTDASSADFDTPEPAGAGTSPSGSRTARRNFRGRDVEQHQVHRPLAKPVLCDRPLPARQHQLAAGKVAHQKMPQMTSRAHPVQPAGSKTGIEQAQRDHFRECVAKKGNMQNRKQ